MGDFKIEIVATGGHGCDRIAKEGEPLYRRCHRLDCPDCIAWEFVNALKRRFPVRTAYLHHWPDTKEAVVDDLLEGKRERGQFSR